MKYSAVLFDADGMTLVSKRFSEQIQKDHGISWEKMKPFFAGPFKECQRGKADLKEELSNVIGEWGWKGSVDELVAYWFGIGNVPEPEIIAIAQELRANGVTCFLATNQEKYRAEYLRNIMGLGRVFDDLLVSCELGHLKKETGYFEGAWKRINQVAGAEVPKESILFVDHEEENLAAAQSFGYKTFCYEDVAGFKGRLSLDQAASVLDVDNERR